MDLVPVVPEHDTSSFVAHLVLNASEVPLNCLDILVIQVLVSSRCRHVCIGHGQI